jgi:hypothetical protein
MNLLSNMDSYIIAHSGYIKYLLSITIKVKRLESQAI